jgi:hypothetical protein
MRNAVVKVNGAAMSTVLGQGQARIPTGGKIRAGIKVLTRRAAENPKAQEIYEHCLAAGQSFEQIETALSAALPALKTPLVPKNVPWFTARGQDFPNPGIAQQILERYAEYRGDGVKRLYRFPLVFPSDMWQAVMPHELASWGLSEKRFWSQYSPDGRVRHCMCYAPVPRDDTGKRAIRVFGGRKAALRGENGGMCDPERCREYQQRQCNLSGRFIFFIPGVRSISAFELHTTSFYAMSAAIQKFETIAFLRGGRLSGFLDAKRTPFYLTKKLMDVPHIDEDGRAMRVPQWIIDLQAPIDVRSSCATTMMRKPQSGTRKLPARFSKARAKRSMNTPIQRNVTHALHTYREARAGRGRCALNCSCPKCRRQKSVATSWIGIAAGMRARCKPSTPHPQRHRLKIQMWDW